MHDPPHPLVEAIIPGPGAVQAGFTASHIDVSITKGSWPCQKERWKKGTDLPRPLPK